MTDTQGFRHTQDMGEICHFSGEHETICQDMLSAGVVWLNGRLKINQPLSDHDQKALFKVVLDASKGKCPDEVFANIIERLRFIAQYGWAAYCDQVRFSRKSEKPFGYGLENQPVKGTDHIVTPQEFAETDMDLPAAKLSYGDLMVGRNFNQSGNPTVDEIKSLYAFLIDIIHRHRNNAPDPETKRFCSIAITEAQTAEMWAVKAITFS